MYIQTVSFHPSIHMLLTLTVLRNPQAIEEFPHPGPTTLLLEPGVLDFCDTHILCMMWHMYCGFEAKWEET
jgi:hypothetical protein